MRRRGLSRRQTGVMAEGWMTRREWSNRGHGRPQVAPDVGVGSVADHQVGGFVQRAIGFEHDVALAVAVDQARARVAEHRLAHAERGSTSGRRRVGSYGKISGVGVTIKKK